MTPSSAGAAVADRGTPSRRRLPRPPRSWASPPDQSPLVVEAPPGLEAPEHGGLLTALLPAVSGLGILAWALSGGSRLLVVLGVVMTVGMVAAGLVARRSSRRGQRRRAQRERERYDEHLHAVTGAIEETARRQRDAALDAHPPPEVWLDRASGGPRLWERRPDDHDARVVQVGRGRVGLVREVRHDAVSPAGVEPEPTLAARARALVVAAGWVEDHPVLLSLGGIGAHDSPVGSSGALVTCVPSDGLVAVVAGDPTGDDERGRALLRALVLELACARPPGELAVVALVRPGTGLGAEPWLHDLPHLVTPAENRAGARAAVRNLARTDGVDVLLVVDLPGPDDADAAAGAIARSGLDDLLLEVQRDGGAALVLVDGRDRCPPVVGTVIELDGDGAAEVRSSRLGSVGAVAARPVAVHVAEATALVTALAQWDPLVTGPASGLTASTLAELLEVVPHTAVEGGQWLRVPLGLDADGTPAELDLREPAQGGHGPHGLIIGATGSGKSELLRTLVGGLLLTHPVDELNAVLVDYKGGATFRGMSGWPHVAGHVSNLDDVGLTDRLADALDGELDRRQRLLLAAGHPDLTAWRAATVQASGQMPAAPPALLVVVDEVAELLQQAPDLLEVLARTCRVGRSLGVHLLLASQRLDEGRLASLDAHLRYRICLRPGSAAQARAVLGVEAVPALPRRPGAALLAVDGEVTRMQVARCSDDDLAGASGGRAPVLSAAARPVWLPPLPRRLPLAGLLGAPAPATPAADDGLRPVVGSVDRPREQDRFPLRLDLRGAGGHVVVAGAARSGTSTALAALVCSLAAASAANQVQVLVVQASGRSLDHLVALPQVGCVAGPAEPTLLRRAVLDTAAVVRSRLGHLPGTDLDAWRHAGRPSGDGRGELVLVVDGWGALQQDDELAEALRMVAADGLSVGVHLAVSVRAWSELRGTSRSAFGTRLELRLQDAYDSEVDRRTASRLPRDVPGRVTLAGGLVGQLADPALATGGLDPSVLDRARSHEGGTAEPVRLLPDRLELSGADLGAPGPLLLGLGEQGLTPQHLEPRDGRSLLVVGEPGSGRTSVLAAHVLQLLAGDREVHLVDPSGTSSWLAPYVASHSCSPDAVRELVRSLAARTASAGSTLAPCVVVDDADLLPRGFGDPLSPLADLLTGSTVGSAGGGWVDLVLARRCAGFTRATFEPVLQRLLELGSATLLLDGSPAEGPLVAGLRARALPPGRALLVRRGRAAEVVQCVVAGAELAERAATAAAGPIGPKSAPHDAVA